MKVEWRLKWNNYVLIRINFDIICLKVLIVYIIILIVVFWGIYDDINCLVFFIVIE